MTRTKRYRVVQEAQPGKLQIRYGRAESFDRDPDIVYNRGFGVPTCDARLLHNIMGSKRYTEQWINGRTQTVEEPSLFDELKARGYDITTIRFSIWQTGKKPKPTQKPKPGPWKKWNLFTVFWKNGVREVFRGQGDTPMEAFELDGQKEEGEIFHWELGSNRSYVWEETERRWIRNERPTPTLETK